MALIAVRADSVAATTSSWCCAYMLVPEMKIPTQGGLDRVMVYLFTCGSVCGTLEFSTVGVTVSVGADPTAGSPSRVGTLIPPLSSGPFCLIYVLVRGTPLGSYLVWAHPTRMTSLHPCLGVLSLLLTGCQLLIVLVSPRRHQFLPSTLFGCSSTLGWGGKCLALGFPHEGTRLQGITQELS